MQNNTPQKMILEIYVKELPKKSSTTHYQFTFVDGLISLAITIMGFLIRQALGG